MSTAGRRPQARDVPELVTILHGLKMQAQRQEGPDLPSAEHYAQHRCHRACRCAHNLTRERKLVTVTLHTAAKPCRIIITAESSKLGCNR
jgi:hypothetical protein